MGFCYLVAGAKLKTGLSPRPRNKCGVTPCHPALCCGGISRQRFFRVDYHWKKDEIWAFAYRLAILTD